MYPCFLKGINMLDEFYAGLITIMVYQPREEQIEKLVKLFDKPWIRSVPINEKRIYFFGNGPVLQWSYTNFGKPVVDLDTFLDGLNKSVITEEEMLSLLE